MIELGYRTPVEWVRRVEEDLDGFLQDHATNEQRVARAALGLVVQHPEDDAMVAALIDVAQEELDHFKQIFDLLRSRGKSLGQEGPDVYMRSMRRQLKHGDVQEWLLRRLILFGVVEARGFERFALLGEHLRDRELGALYEELARSEARHQGLYLRLARERFDSARVETMLERVLTMEAEAIAQQPLRAALH